MSTRCNIHFAWPGGQVAANIYRHCDGRPDVVLADLARFFDDVADGTHYARFDDAEGLAARYLVWQSAVDRFPTSRGILGFWGLSPCIKDHGDIEYLYTVTCQDGARPSVSYKSIDDVTFVRTVTHRAGARPLVWFEASEWAEDE